MPDIGVRSGVQWNTKRDAVGSIFDKRQSVIEKLNDLRPSVSPKQGGSNGFLLGMSLPFPLVLISSQQHKTNQPQTIVLTAAIGRHPVSCDSHEWNNRKSMPDH